MRAVWRSLQISTLTRALAVAVCVSGLSVACAKERARTAPDNSIGVATMEADGTIVLSLRATAAGGVRGETQLRYPKGHDQYEAVLKHLGGLRPGESKPVPPWPDRSTRFVRHGRPARQSALSLFDPFRQELDGTV